MSTEAEPGAAGEKGDQGPRGADGAPGPVGPAGPKGEQVRMGDVGSGEKYRGSRMGVKITGDPGMGVKNNCTGNPR